MECVWYVIGFAVTALVAYFAIAYLFPWFKGIIGDNNFATILTMVQLFMTAAEQNGKLPTGADRSKWVVKMVLSKFPKLNAEYVQALIDGSMTALTQDGLINQKKDAKY